MTNWWARSRVTGAGACDAADLSRFITRAARAGNRAAGGAARCIALAHSCLFATVLVEA